jgi:uncharacterized protein
MIFLLSPAKSLDYSVPGQLPPQTQPLFVQHSKVLIDILRDFAPQQIATLMDLSDNLAALNVGRYQAWSEQTTADNALAAVLAFNGDVYEGLDARSLSLPQLDWLQQHLCILSGLYGVLRPLDFLQPYRLEMGTRLANPTGKDLYQFWKKIIAPYLNERLSAQPAPVIVNLASQEYFKAVDTKALNARVVECVFQENKAGDYKIVSFMAKRARGLMVRYATEQQCQQPEQLCAFDVDGYAYAPDVSTPERLVFRR